MPPRTELGIEPPEAKAAVAIAKLAELIQDLCYSHEAQGVPAAMVKILCKIFRVAKRATVFYRGDNHVLVWDPPEFRFTKKVTK